MAQAREEERRPGLFVTLLADTGGRIALASLAAAVVTGAYGASLAFATLTAPAPPAAAPKAAAKLSAPADPNLRQITPQTSMDVVPIAADPGVHVAGRESDAAQALQAAAQNADVPTVAAPKPDAVAQAGADIAAQLAAAKSGGGRAAGKTGPFKTKYGNAFGAATATGSQAATDFVGSKLPAGNDSAVPSAPSANGPSAPPPGQSRAMDKDRGVERIAAGSGRAAAGGSRGGAMRQLGDAKRLASRGGGLDAQVSHGAQTFDGGAELTHQTQSAVPQGPTDAQKEAAAATPEDYGEGGGAIAQKPQGGGVSSAPDAGHSNATPWQGLVDAANQLMLSAMLVMIAEWIMVKTGVVGYPKAHFLCYLAMLMGAAVIALGAKVMAMGQSNQAMMMILGGGVVVLGAIVTLISQKPPADKAEVGSKTAELSAQSQEELAANKANVGGMHTAGKPGCPPQQMQ